ncbi:MAG: DUF3017 domain-containing protein [Actinobacteria bacterium]|uniref:Unannotated protein n=1 Tax=freshwater metagenome TaxID=449393 RepID=A0A6J7EFS7_9ZZZZ|nr:DUF3017 domain-containing protein [Actinomycetota bacterium]
MSGVDDDGLAEVRPIRKPKRWRRISLAQWPITVVLLGIGISLFMIATDHFRRGSIVLSASVMLAMFLRLMLPSADAGMLAVRTRRIDVIVLATLAIGLSVFTYWVPAPN